MRLGSSLRLTRLTRLAAASAMMASVGAGPGFAQGEGSFMREALSTIGLIERPKAPIDYRERAPLVVPPKLELVPPQSRATARAQSWPVDRSTLPPTEAELAAARARQEELAVGLDGTHIHTVNPKRSQGGGLQSVFSEIQKGRASGDTSRRRITGAGKEGGGTHLSVEDEIDVDAGKPKLASGAEPERRRLADPPKGYRTPPKVDHVVQPVQVRNPWDPLGLFTKRD